MKLELLGFSLEAAQRARRPCMLIGMRESTSVRVDRRTRDELRLLADADGVSLDEAVSRLVGAERQRRMGEALSQPITDAEQEWLDVGLRTVTDASG